MEHPLISVIIPIYNVEEYLERCVKSLFDQSLENIEFIFVDDCSIDNSVKVLGQIIELYNKQLLAENKHVVLYKMPQNRGLHAVRQKGIELAKGDYVIFCDSDDWVDKNMYERLWLVAVSGNYDVVCSNYLRTDGQNEEKEKKFIPQPGNKPNILIKLILNWKISCSTCTKLIKKELFFGGFEYPKYDMWEDMVIMSQIFLKSKRIIWLDECYYYYYKNPNSICNNIKTVETRRNQAMQVINNTRHLLDILKKNNFMPNDDVYVIVNRALTLGRCLNWTIYVDSFPYYNFRLLLSGNISLMSKLAHLTKILGLYSVLKNDK